jgi:hypothetical protein
VEVHGDQLLRRAERRRAEEHGADHAEQGGHRAQAEREGQRGGEGGGAMAVETAEREANVGGSHASGDDDAPERRTRRPPRRASAQKGSKMWGRFSGEIPEPESDTIRAVRSARGQHSTGQEV